MISECGRPVNIKSEEENVKNGGSNFQNCKKMLEYSTETLSLKANYQNLLGVRKKIILIMINYNRAVTSNLYQYLTIIKL